MMRFVKLTKGQFAIVDPCDVPNVSRYRWQAKWNRDTKTFYASRGWWEGGKCKQEYMHRSLLGNPAGLLVDHADKNTLDNRRHNLRKCTRSQNKYNQKRRKDSTTGFKCVYKNGNGWVARFTVDKKFVYVGTFTTAEKAYAAYCERVKQVHGEFARVV